MAPKSTPVPAVSPERLERIETVATMVSRGRSWRVIARDVGMSVRTVRADYDLWISMLPEALDRDGARLRIRDRYESMLSDAADRMDAVDNMGAPITAQDWARAAIVSLRVLQAMRQLDGLDEPVQMHVDVSGDLSAERLAAIVVSAETAPAGALPSG